MDIQADRLVRTDSSHLHFRELVAKLDAELAIRNGDSHGFYNQFNKIDAIQHCVVLYVNGSPQACGAFKAFDKGIVEIKRMFVEPDQRGHGLAQQVLVALEQWAAEEGMQSCVLETGKNLPEAIRLYEKAGYRQIPNYGQYIGIDNSVCFEKKL